MDNQSIEIEEAEDAIYWEDRIYSGLLTEDD